MGAFMYLSQKDQLAYCTFNVLKKIWQQSLLFRSPRLRTKNMAYYENVYQMLPIKGHLKLRIHSFYNRLPIDHQYLKHTSAMYTFSINSTYLPPLFCDIFFSQQGMIIMSQSQLTPSLTEKLGTSCFWGKKTLLCKPLSKDIDKKFKLFMFQMYKIDYQLRTKKFIKQIVWVKNEKCGLSHFY